MQVKSKSGRTFKLPSEEEDVAINAGIAVDSDAHELSDEEFKKLRPVGRPKAEKTKEPVSIRLSNEVTDYFRSFGKGWQTRIDDVLKDYVSTHK